MKPIDVIAFGTCYVDICAEKYPFDENGISAETELVGGAYEIVAGGSAVNFCRILGSFGLDTAFIGMAGKDHMGHVLRTLLVESDIDPNLIQREQLITNVSFNMTNPEGAHVMCVAGTANAALGPKEVLPKLGELAGGASMLYLGGCCKLTSFKDAFPEVIKLAAQHEVDVIVDHGRIPEGISEEMLAVVRQLVLDSRYYFPSKQEFCQLWDVEDIESGLTLLAGKAPSLTVVVKDGSNGAYYWDKRAHRVPAIPVINVKHLAGAGDSFNAGVISAILGKRSLGQAVLIGCETAATKISGMQI